MISGSAFLSRERLVPAGRFAGCLLLAALVGALISPGRAGADTGPWSRPVKISTGQSGWFPDVAAADDGRVHVVWNQSQPEETEKDPVEEVLEEEGLVQPSVRVLSALYYSRWDGKSWTKPNDIAVAQKGVALRSALAVDGAGHTHLLRLGIGDLQADSTQHHELDVWHTRSDGARAESVMSWTPPKRVSRDASGYFTDIAIDSRGVIHVIWSENIAGAPALLYSNSRDGGASWSPRVVLDGSSFVWWYRAQLKVDARDRLHVVWEVTDRKNLGSTRGAVYARSEDGGASWSHTIFPENLPPYPFYRLRGPGPQQPTIGIDGRGDTLLVYRDGDTGRVLYRVSTDGIRWSPPAPLPGVRAGVDRPYDVYDTVTDSAGRVHLAVVAYPDGFDTMSLLHAEWNGQGWSSPDVIVGSPPYPEYPRLALSEGRRLHVVWFGGDRHTVDRDPVGIWYSTAETSAPRAVGRGIPASDVQGALAPVPRAADRSIPSPAGSAPDEWGREPRGDGGGLERPAEWVSGLHRRQPHPVILGFVSTLFLLAVALAAKPRLLDALGPRSGRVCIRLFGQSPPVATGGPMEETREVAGQ